MTLVISLSLVALLVAILLIFFFAKINISVFVHNKDILVKAGKIKVYSTKRNGKKPKKDASKGDKFEKGYKGVKHIVNLVKRVFEDENDDLLLILRYIRDNVQITRLDVALEYGFSEAALTGIAGGAIWVAISSVCSFLSRYVDIKRFLNLAVKPDYDGEVFNFDVKLVFRTRFFHLYKTVRYVLRFIKTLKGGK